jgi:hypothetical protein
MLAALLLILAFFGVPSMAKTTGHGELTRRPATFRIIVPQPLARFGDDGIRVTYEPALGEYWSIELHPVAANQVVGDISFYGVPDQGVTFTHPPRRVRLDGWMSLGMSRRRYDALAAKIDAALAERDPPADQGAPASSAADVSQMVICTDAAGYLTERRKRGQTAWMALNACDDEDHFADVGHLMAQAFPELRCFIAFHDNADACRPPEPPDEDDPK